MECSEFLLLGNFPCFRGEALTPVQPIWRSALRLLRRGPGSVHQDEFAAAAGQMVAPTLSDYGGDLILFYPEEDAPRTLPQRRERSIVLKDCGRVGKQRPVVLIALGARVDDVDRLARIEVDG